MKRLFASRLFSRAFFGTTAAIALLFTAMYLATVPFIESTVREAEEHAARTALDNIFGMVEQIERDLQGQRQAILLARKNELRGIVAVAESLARRLDVEVDAGRLTRRDARRHLLDQLRGIRYGRNDYVWAADYGSVLVAHPDPKLDHADFATRRDVRGNLIVPPMVDDARRVGEGFHSYWWRRLGETEPVEKLSFYKHLPTFGLVIGSGVYVDDIDRTLAARRVVAQDNLRGRLRNLRIAKTGYMYVFDGEQRMLIHPNPNIENTGFAELREPESGQPLGRMLMAAADKAEGVRYKWDHPADPGHYVYDKIAWVRHYEAADWYVGSSVYVAELRESAEVLKRRLLLAFFATWSIAVVIVYFSVKRLIVPLKSLAETARRVQEGDFGARNGLRRDDEIGVVADAFDAMVDQLHDNIEHLDAHVRRRTAELEKANTELTQLDRLKSDFLSTVSHELRTPMTSVIGFAKLIGRKLDDAIFPKLAGDDEKSRRAVAQVRNNLAIVVEESERLTRLIDNVLDSAKLEAGKMEWHFDALEPERLLEQVAAVVAPLAQQKGLRLVWRATPGLPAVKGDAARLRQVLVNLLFNAVKFTPQGGIVAEAIPGEDGFVRFAVSDSGVGIAADQIEKVFDKFRQIGDTLTDKPQGTGLGLSICRQIVEGHGGHIHAESMPGQGSVFRFTLPVAEKRNA